MSRAWDSYLPGGPLPQIFTVSWDFALLGAAVVAALAVVVALLCACAAVRRSMRDSRRIQRQTAGETGTAGAKARAAARRQLSRGWALSAALVAASACAAAWTWTWTESVCFSRVDDPWAHTGGQPITEVPVLGAGDVHRVAEFKAKGLPVLFRGALNATDEISIAEWSPEALAQRLGHHRIEVQLSNVEQEETQLMDVGLGEFLTGLNDTEWLDTHRRADGRMPYLAESSELFYVDPQLIAQSHKLLKAVHLRDTQYLLFQHLFWMGPKGAVTGLHSDIDPLNLLLQMYGKKTLWLFPITETKYLYKSGKYDFGASLSHVDPFNPDLEKFPDYAKATPLPVEVQTGDVLFVPAHWYHYARSNSVSISISVRVFTLCESLSIGVWSLMEMAHQWGFYTPAEGCVCHEDGSSSPY